MAQTTPVPQSTVTNGDERLDFGEARFAGNYHKTLPRLSIDGFKPGEVDPKSYIAFANICDFNGDFEFTPAATHATQLNNPQAGRAAEQLGPNPDRIHMLPAPSVLSDSTAAEVVELFWMAQLRDLPFNQFGTNADVANAIADIGTSYQRALASEGHTTGDLRLGLDLPASMGALDVSAKTLFRTGLKDEEHGPLVSQFFLHDINYGAQLIQQTEVPYKSGQNYLIEFDKWLTAQETGRDKDGNDYGGDNSFSADPNYYETSRRRIATMRDLARFVNRDALHQAYFNAAILLLNWGAPFDSGNPYSGNHPGGGYKRQVGFGTLGGPNLLALVSEVASRALKVVWRQKWLHRRLRPEAYGGLMHMQKKGEKRGGKTIKRDYGLPEWLFDPALKIETFMKKSEYLLPIAYTAGSPPHPAYGAGHATVAGACVTILKAWFDEDQHIQPLFEKVNTSPQKDPSPYFPASPPLTIWEPGTFTTGVLPQYGGSDDVDMTVGGELNKLASNVAMGRSMGGVHWRSDNTRSLRLGEQMATIMLSRILPTYAEKPSLSYTNFDRNLVTIHSDGKVTVAGDPELELFYARQF
jgi:hypothetical protein